MLKELIKVAEKLDSIGRAKEANFVDSLIKKVSSDFNEIGSFEGVSRGYPGSDDDFYNDFDNTFVEGGLDNQFEELESAIKKVLFIANPNYTKSDIQKAIFYFTHGGYGLKKRVNKR